MGSARSLFGLQPSVVLVYGCFAFVLIGTTRDLCDMLAALIGFSLLELILERFRHPIRSLFWKILLIGVVALLNGALAGSGSPDIFIGTFGIHVRAVVDGLVMGAMLVALLEIASCMGSLVGPEDMPSFLMERLPSFALMLSMTLNLISQVSRRAATIEEVRRACTAMPPSSSRISEAGRLVTSLMEWSFESSFARVDAMRARGWGSSAVRTRFKENPFSVGDRIALIATATIGALALGGVAVDHSAAQPVARMVFILFLLLPFLAILIEEGRWR